MGRLVILVVWQRCVSAVLRRDLRLAGSGMGSQHSLLRYPHVLRVTVDTVV